MTAFSDRIKEFADLNAEVLGVSLDTVFVHKAWIQTPRDKNGVGEIKYPLGSDSTQQAARDYGVVVHGDPERDPENLQLDDVATARLRAAGPPGCRPRRGCRRPRCPARARRSRGSIG